MCCKARKKRDNCRQSLFLAAAKHFADTDMLCFFGKNLPKYCNTISSSLFRFGNVYDRKDVNGDLLLICERKVLPNHNEYCHHNRGSICRGMCY